MSHQGWPARLVEGDLTLRPLRPSDARIWQEVRRRNVEWLRPWDATVPPGARHRPRTFRALVAHLTQQARKGHTMPFAIEFHGQFVGQVTVNNIVRGSAQFASIGYWIDSAVAGRGLVPLAVAMAIDHCFGSAGLHRIEVCIRPENTNSLRVVEKLGIREVGFAPRYLHIDGDWRDHRIYAITAEECPHGLVRRLSSHQHHQ